MILKKVNSFEEIAKIAYEKVIFKINNYEILKEKDIKNIWEESCIEYGKKDSIVKKGCPKNAFIGILKELNLNIQWEEKESKNAYYSRIGINILKNNRDKKYTKQELWKEILKELKIEKKSHNGQVDVILALWNKNIF